MSRKDRWLLPDGIEEILPDDARRLEALRRRLLDLFDSWGYDLVMPPMIEYLDALLTGVGRDLDLQTFKLTDQLTGRLMGVRADITPQAARIDAHYLKREAPARLCYFGPILRTRPSEFGGSREPLQVGAELFGHAGVESEIEILRLMLAACEAAGLPRPVIDLGHVGVFRGLAREAGLQPEQEAELIDALQRRSAGDIEQILASWDLAAKDKARFSALLQLGGGIEVIAAARAQLGSVAGVKAALSNLETVVAGVGAEASSVHIDLAELHGYRYYTGTVFSAFIEGYGDAVAQGGRYDDVGKAFGRARPAVGFSADARLLLKLTGAGAQARGGIFAPADADETLQAKVAALRATGERVVAQLCAGEASARELGCDRELKKKDGQWTVVNLK